MSDFEYDVLTSTPEGDLKKGRKVKRDGAILRNKEEICRDYD